MSLDRSRWGYFLIGLFIFLFIFSVFKNLGYPLLWNDEADTVIYAPVIMQYGYPKVHDGKNVMNLTEGEDKGLGVKESIDAYIHLGWSQYYVATVGAYLAGQVEDIYLKTFYLRLPFAVIGILGVFLLPWAFLKAVKKERRLFVLVYLVMELASVFLVLHLRTVRHHVLSLFLTTALLGTFVNFRIFKCWRIGYYVVFPALLLLLFVTFYPMFFMFILFLGIYETISLLTSWNEGIRREKYRLLLPIFVSGVLVIPLINFFEVFYISRKFSEYMNYGWDIYLKNILFTIDFFLRYEYLSLLIAAKAILLFYLKTPKKIYLLVKNNQQAKVSATLSLYVLAYVLVVAKIGYLFERYLISLQPVMVLAVLIDVYLIIDLLGERKDRVGRALVYVFASIFMMASIFRVELWWDRVYEMFHKYQGPMDYAIAYIQDRYDDTASLVIATNYEEYVYMYYLGSKVTVGFVGNNLEEDSKFKPDIVIPRKGRPNNRELLDGFIENGDYEKVMFPVYDYSYNNIPELSLRDSHLFGTKYAENEADKLVIYVEKTEN